MNLIRLTTVALLAVRIVLPATADEFESHIRTWDLPQKKIIEWDWETSFYSLEYLQQHVKALERIPFDGMAITIIHDDKHYKDELDDAVRKAIERRDGLNEWSSRDELAKPLIKPKRAHIRHITPGLAEPEIDGVLDEEMWANATELSGFTHILHYTRATVVGATISQVAWNDRGIYIGTTCKEPETEPLRNDPEQQKKGNRLRLVIAADGNVSSFYRLNFDMTGFLSIYANSGGEKTWNDQWTAEWFVPWSCIGGKSNPMKSRRATLHRIRPSSYESTSWSPLVDPNLWDIGNLGTWVFMPGM